MSAGLPHVQRIQCCQTYHMYEDYSVVRFTTCMKTTVVVRFTTCMKTTVLSELPHV